MIGFSCTNCGHTFGVQDQYEGQRIKCPRCNCVGLVVDDSGRIKIICQNCGNENAVPETLDGQNTTILAHFFCNSNRAPMQKTSPEAPFN